MVWNVTFPITGTAQQGLSTPTYSGVRDSASSPNAILHAITTLGGTQTNVRAHTTSDPFTILAKKPQSIRALPSANPVTGKYGAIPVNTYSILVTKGVNFAPNQAPVFARTRMEFEVPAGSDSNDPANHRAALSCAFGVVQQQSSGWGDTIVTGVLGN